MGKTKIKTIDDAAPVEEPKKKPAKKQEDTLVAKLRQELGITEEEITKEKRARVEEGAAQSAAAKVVGAVEPSTEQEDAEQSGAKPAYSEPRGRASDTLRPDKQAQTKKASAKVKHRSKRYQQALAKIDKSKAYSLETAVKLAKEVSYAQFGGSLEIHLNTAVKNLRGLAALPFSSGKKLKILAFPSTSLGTSDLKELEDEGVIIGDDKTLAEIEQGKINFDLLVTIPKWMPKIAKVAKVLGPRGLMPNPKNNTVTDDLKKAIAELQSGKSEYKTEKQASVIHLALGKIDQPNEELEQNIKVLLSTIGKSKITKVVLSPTMGPSVKLDLSAI